MDKKWLIARIGERSSWLGIYTILGLVGMHVQPEMRDLIIDAILAVAAVLAFIFRENTHE